MAAVAPFNHDDVHMASFAPATTPTTTSNHAHLLQASRAHLLAVASSPRSWRPASFGSRFYPGCSPGQLLGPLDPTEFKVSSSVESDRNVNMVGMPGQSPNETHCKDYQCCGLVLNDLHALVDHFETCHVVVPYAPYATPAYPNVPTLKVDGSLPTSPLSQDSGAFNPDDMEFDDDGFSTAPSSGASTPPETPVSTPISSFPSPSLRAASSALLPPVSAFETHVLPPSSSSAAAAAALRYAEAFNSYAGYADFSSAMPGAAAAPLPEEAGTPDDARARLYGAVRPTALFSPTGSPPSSRRGSPSPTSPTGRSAAGGPSRHNSTGASAARASTTLSRPASSLLLSKPFRCPKPNCNKSYKQANGLKYHITHGSCNFAPPKEVEEVSAVLAARGCSREEGMTLDESLECLSELELREVEREAERRLKPFACGIGECTRRYKNMNGLRYHYQHSGDHGAIGLGLLASGQHECLRNNHGRSRNPAPVAAPSSSSVVPPLPTPPPMLELAPPSYARVLQQQTFAFLQQNQHRLGGFSGLSIPQQPFSS